MISDFVASSSNFDGCASEMGGVTPRYLFCPSPPAGGVGFVGFVGVEGVSVLGVAERGTVELGGPPDVQVTPGGQ